MSNGFYSVGGRPILNKIEALLEATKLKQQISWHYFDDKFASVNVEQVKTVPLAELYRLRAQQLRDKYDYLILNYSGGSDSHNILMTFLQHRIKLDCVHVQWHTSLVDKGLYTPNAEDKTNFNFHSEWDLVIKKDLEWLASTHPEIRIEMTDWLENLSEKTVNDNIFTLQSGVMPNISRAAKLNTYAKIESELTDKGLKVGSIFGAEKPYLVEKNSEVFCFFRDKMCVAQPNPNNPHGTEYFYVTPDLPELTIRQSLEMLDWFKLNRARTEMIGARSQRYDHIKDWTVNDFYKEYEVYAEIAKSVLYPHWDFNRFQSGKPVPNSDLTVLPKGVKAWDKILLAVPEFKRIPEIWNYYWDSYRKEIDNTLILAEVEMRSVDSKWYYIGRLA